jgi:hypothetical protein
MVLELIAGTEARVATRQSLVISRDAASLICCLPSAPAEAQLPHDSLKSPLIPRDDLPPFPCQDQAQPESRECPASRSPAD